MSRRRPTLIGWAMVRAEEHGAGADAPTAAWLGRYDELAGRRLEDLDADELEVLAQAAFWLGRPRETLAARHRAYAVLREAGDDERAAETCWRLFHNHFELDETSAASGWLHRAERHVAARPGCVEAGYVAIAAALWAAYEGRPDEAVTHAHAAHQTGLAHGDGDLVAWALATEGGMRIGAGDVAGGLALLDEAMVETVSGELSPFVTGWIYCFLLKTCQGLGDVRRAGEWTDAAMRWCEGQGVNSWYPGVCRLHRCEVASLRGEWAAAEEEALRAAEELAPFGDYLIAHSHYVAGEIRRLCGDLTAAEAAFRRAHELGHDPQPGLALLHLARGDAGGALAQLGLALRTRTHTPLTRGRMLAAHVQAALEVGDLQAATASVDELSSLARSSDSRLLWGLLASSHGALLLARDDLDGGMALLREAVETYRQLACPYEAAQVRVLLGRGAREAGDEDTARLELDAARGAFERLGARPEAEHAAALTTTQSANPNGLSDRELEVLRLVASGLSNREVAARLVISEHTVRRHLSNLYRKIGVTSRSAATAFVFEHDLAE